MLLFDFQELGRAEMIGRTLLSPAVSGKDFERTEGMLLFEPGQRNTVLDVNLMPDTRPSSTFPKRFQIVLFNAKGGARIDEAYGTANVTLVSDATSQALWELAEELQQPLEEDTLRRVLHGISVKVATESTDEQLSVAMHLIEKVQSPCACQLSVQQNSNSKPKAPLCYNVSCCKMIRLHF